MTIKSVADKPTGFKLKTGLKAGEHCRDAFKAFIRNPTTQSNRNFVDCCRKDDRCLQ